MSVKLNTRQGITCGLRSDGSRCVLWDDNDEFQWFKAEEFSKTFSA